MFYNYTKIRPPKFCTLVGWRRGRIRPAPFMATALVIFTLPAVLMPASTRAVTGPMLAPEALEAPAAPLVVTQETGKVDAISAGDLRLPANVAMSIVRASAGTGVDLKLLIAVAHRESAFKPEARARTSSATGLYQFIDSTWLTAVQKFGARHGLTREASLISPSGEVSGGARRACILGLRNNPDIAAAMAAEMLRRDATYLKGSLERKLTDTDLYAAHFLGVHKAAKLATLSSRSPDVAAAKVFPRAARANRSIFYQRQGRRLKSRTVRGVYDRLALPYAEDADLMAQKVRRIFGHLAPLPESGATPSHSAG